MVKSIVAEPKIVPIPAIELTGLRRLPNKEVSIPDSFAKVSPKLALVSNREDVWMVDKDIGMITIHNKLYVRHPNEPEGLSAGFVSQVALARGRISKRANIATTALVGDAKIGIGVIVGWASIVEDGADIGDLVKIGHNVVVCSGAVIGVGAEISDNLVIKSGAVIPRGKFVTEEGEILDTRSVPRVE